MPEITVKGMSCGHCAAAVTEALESLPGVKDVQVDLTSGRVTFTSMQEIFQEDLMRAIKAAGFELAVGPD